MFFDTALPKVENAFRTYDESKSNGATMKTHVIRTVKWYCVKYMDRRLKIITREKSFTDLEDYNQHNDGNGRPEIENCACRNSEKDFQNYELREKVNRLMNVLNVEQRRIVYLHTGKGQTFFEIGELIGKSASYVRVQHARAMQQLRESAANDYEGAE